ncbi:MAG: hypothetical protein Kow0031_13290 [Anaerolineae bacterium]
MGATVAAGTAYFSLQDESNEPVVDRVQIPVKNLPAAIEGFTIAVMADFHLYPFTQLELIDRAVAMANALNPDVAVLLGDFVWHEVEAIFDLAPALAGLNPRHGIFTILGNHDIWTDVEVIKTGLAEARLPLLVNQGLSLPVGGSQLYLAGLDDGWSGQPDLPAALDGAPADAPVVLLYHEPDLANDTSLDGRVALQLSGHSHGGQVRPLLRKPLITPYLSWDYDMGLYQVNDMWLYVNRGLGTTNVPVRINCPPEITEITLIRA